MAVTSLAKPLTGKAAEEGTRSSEGQAEGEKHGSSDSSGKSSASSSSGSIDGDEAGKEEGKEKDQRPWWKFWEGGDADAAGAEEGRAESAGSDRDSPQTSRPVDAIIIPPDLPIEEIATWVCVCVCVCVACRSCVCFDSYLSV